MRRQPVTTIAIAASVIAIVLGGSISALLITQNGNATRVAATVTETLPATTVTTVGPATDTNGTTATSPTAPAQAAASAAASTTLPLAGYSGLRLSAQVPAGWNTEEDESDKGSYVEPAGDGRAEHAEVTGSRSSAALGEDQHSADSISIDARRSRVRRDRVVLPLPGCHESTPLRSPGATSTAEDQLRRWRRLMRLWGGPLWHREVLTRRPDRRGSDSHRRRALATRQQANRSDRQSSLRLLTAAFAEQRNGLDILFRYGVGARIGIQYGCDAGTGRRAAVRVSR
jgi:hypothetical protein